MGQANGKKRLDEILVEKGLISEGEIKEALLRQKARGGKFGSQLLYYRYIDETGLVEALKTQLECEGVVLSGLEIPEIIIKLIPQKVAEVRRVIPFDYNPDENVIKIACPDPNDQSLINELNFVARGKNVKLYVAAEIAITTAIARFYHGQDITLEDNLLLEIPDIATDTGRIPTLEESAAPELNETNRPAILLVTDEIYTAPLLQSILERDNYRVVMTDSADDAYDIIGDMKFQSMLVKDTVPGDYLRLIDRVRKISPGTTVRYYGNTASLLLQKEAITVESDLLQRNLDLFTSLLSSKSKLPINHGGQVGHYTEKLCRELGLPEKDRMLITNAAYIHDLARFYYHSEEAEDNRKVVQLTIKLLASLNYPPVVLEMLKSMYLDLNDKYTRHLPIEILGGNILTIVDLFCDSTLQYDRLSLDRFDAIRKKLRDMIGKLFLAEVVEAFIDLIQEEILDHDTSRNNGQVMIYCKDLLLLQPLEMRLKNEGFRTVSHTSTTSFIDLYKRSRPDIMILVVAGESHGITLFIDELTEGGIEFEKTPTFLLTDTSSISRLTGLLERGVEDIIARDNNLDMLVTKISKFQARSKTRVNKSDEVAGGTSGARGRLADMNLIDLLQALGPSLKTVKISVINSAAEGDRLTIYLDRGSLSFAQLRDLVGAEAVYEGLTWGDGIWTVEPIGPESLPAPNNDLSNESILMEGCRLMDEKLKSGQLL
nr:DUF4388 domain-containing protein [candidate division Zixibacteria bacterium]